MEILGIVDVIIAHGFKYFSTQLSFALELPIGIDRPMMLMQILIYIAIMQINAFQKFSQEYTPG